MVERIGARLAEERGIAVIVALLISMVVVTLGITSVTLAVHNSEASNNDRRRVQAIAAAEAGVNWYFSHLQSMPLAEWECTKDDPDLPTTPPTQFSAGLYDGSGATMPPAPLVCPLTELPARVLIQSKGSSTVNPVPTRTMQALVELSVLGTAAFQGVSIYSETSMSWPSNVKILGRTGNDASLYSNGNITLRGNDVVGGNVEARGTVTLEQSVQVRGNVVAGATTAPAISMRSSSTVLGSATATASSITVQQSKAAIWGDATAGTTITAGGSAIKGQRTENQPDPDYEWRDFPAFDYVESGWVAAGYQVDEFTDCGLARDFITQGGLIIDGKNLIRITGDCDLNFDGNAPALRGDLAIVSDGSLTVGNNTPWTSGDGLLHSLHLVFGYDNDGAPCNMKFGNNSTIDPGVLTFMHTPCTVDMGSSALILEGQIIAGGVILKPGTQLTYRPMTIPGMGGGVPAEDIVYIREIITEG